jgi:serine/threonine protein kinase
MDRPDATADPEPTAAEFERIVAICDRFEAAWRGGERPRIEEFLAANPSISRPALLRELVALELELARATRDSPAPTVGGYRERFPDFAEIVEAVFAETVSDGWEQLLVDGVGGDAGAAEFRLTPGGPDLGGATDRGGADLPSRIGKYQIVRSLGSGGQASALLAFDPDLRRHVVMKQYHAASFGADEAAPREGQALARVQSPYVARCLGVERVGKAVYLVIEYIVGENLAKFRAEKPLAPAAAAELIGRLAEGLAAVHACGLLHRDIKPSNILVGDDGNPRLVDFGLAVPLASTALSGLSGTLPYMAPEQARGEPERIDPRTDIFGLGAVLYDLLTGRPPYQGKNRGELLRQAQQCQHQPPRRIKPAVPRALERICLKAMAAAPDNRYVSALELHGALRGYRRRRKARPFVFAAVAAMVLLAAAAGIWRLRAPAIASAAALPNVPTVPAQSPQTHLILSLEITHLPWLSDKKVYDKDRIGILGDQSFSTRLNDDVKSRAELSEPAFSYVVAFRPDGVVELVAPQDEGTAPTRTDHPQYPPESDPGKVYSLSDGAGLCAFALVVSRAKLPPFREWRAKHGDAPWGKGLEANPGIVWRHDGHWLVPLTAEGRAGVRAKGHELRGGGAPVAKLAKWLLDRPGVDEVVVEAFAVEPSAAPK